MGPIPLKIVILIILIKSTESQIDNSDDSQEFDIPYTFTTRRSAPIRTREHSTYISEPRKAFRIIDSRPSVPQEPRATLKSPWTWACINTVNGDICERRLYEEGGRYPRSNGTTGRVPHNVCWLNCGQYGALWPYPTMKTELGRKIIPFLPGNVEITNISAENSGVKAMIGYAANIFLEQLFKLIPKPLSGQSNEEGPLAGNKNFVLIGISVQNADIHIGLNTDESYSLSITTSEVEGSQTVYVDISAPTFFGARHGIETLSQLIAYDDVNRCLQILNEALIYDQPYFPYRGLMIDTGRNFIPIGYLKRMVKAMSYNKLNVLHWHLTDSNAFPFFSKRVPQMTKYGAYTPSKIYTPAEVVDLILFAKLRGVKIVPELDAPAHAGNGWQWGKLEGYGELANCVNSEPWRRFCAQPPCGQLNPLNNNTYIILGELYKDFLDVFDRDLFHMGGDEVSYKCWFTVPEIKAWQKLQEGYGEYSYFSGSISPVESHMMDLWGHFQNEALKKLKEANGGAGISPIVWTSEMTKTGRRFLDPEEYIIQIWSGSNDREIGELLEEGYRVIFSNVDRWYLDHGYGTWLGTEHGLNWRLKSWQTIYDTDILKISSDQVGMNFTHQYLTSGKILGGEACLWSERVDQHNMELKLWPRGAALAERLWSNPAARKPNTNARIMHQRARMTSRGIHADRLQPESCHVNQGFCDDPHNRI